MTRSALVLLTAAALAGGCSSPQELTGAAAARSRGAAITEAGSPRALLQAENPLTDYARVLARVNGKVITLRQIRHLVGPMYEQSLDKPEMLEAYIAAKTQDLVLKQLVLDEAEKLGIRATDDEMKRDLETEEEKAAKRDTTVEQMLMDQGITRREWDQDRRERICYQFADQYFSGYAPDKWYREESFRPSVDPYVGPGETLRWALDHREKVMDVPESATIRILDLRKDSFGGPGAGENEKWSLCGEAMDAAVARVRGGESFADVARVVSEGPEAPAGGLLDGVRRSAPLRAEYLDWIFAEETKEGDISPRLRLPTGFVVLLLEKRNAARTLSAEEWGPWVRAQLETSRREVVHHEVLIRLLEEAAVSPPEFRESLLRALQEKARNAREALR
jgi:hypothetical protein